MAGELSLRADRAFSADTVEVEAMERLLLRAWPGNVRELDAALAAARRLDPGPGLRLWAVEEVLGEGGGQRAALTEEAALAAVAAARGNVSEAALRLGVSRGKLLRLLRRTGERDGGGRSRERKRKGTSSLLLAGDKLSN